jgi:HAE1 family hydrophobic/amphiphilic exporter-1
MSVVFTLNTDIRLAEQSVSLSVSRARGEFPQGTLEPTISALDPSDVPLMTLALSADLPEDKLNLLADLEIRPKLEEVANIGSVRMEGARKREIEVELDRQKLTARQMSAMEVVQSLRESGVTVPAGVEHGPDSDTLVRSVGDFKSLEDIRLAPIRFPGNETIVSLREIADVRDGMTDEKMRAHMNGRSAVIYKVFRQHGADALETAKALDDRVAEIERTYQDKIAGLSLSVAHDGTAPIRESADAAREAILIGIVLAIVVVYLFLGSLRSTFITAVALPNSIFGAFFDDVVL